MSDQSREQYDLIDAFLDGRLTPSGGDHLIKWLKSDPENLRAIARWIRENLGELTPWHVTRFFPCAEMRDVPPTPLETLETARRIGIEEGLKFVYIGNVAEDQNTYCPSCGKLAIERFGYATRVVDVTADGSCASCGASLGITNTETQK